MKIGRTPRQQMLSSLDFLRMSFSGKLQFMLWPPLVAAAAVAFIFWAFPKANFAHDRGLLDISAGLLSMLVGFFVAALGLAITLESKLLDTVSEHNPPMLGEVKQSWRDFARAITAYLVIVALFTYLAAMAGMVVQPAAEAMAATEIGSTLRIAAAALYTFLFAHVVSVTLLALFLLAVKIPEVQSELAPTSVEPEEEEQASLGSALRQNLPSPPIHDDASIN